MKYVAAAFPAAIDTNIHSDLKIYILSRHLIHLLILESHQIQSLQPFE